jgi:hypothetical protein
MPTAWRKPERVNEQVNGSEEKRWRRAIQDAKRQTAQHGEAEVCERLAIDAFGKFSVGHRLRKTQANVFGE